VNRILRDECLSIGGFIEGVDARAAFQSVDPGQSESNVGVPFMRGRNCTERTKAIRRHKVHIVDISTSATQAVVGSDQCRRGLAS